MSCAIGSRPEVVKRLLDDNARVVALAVSTTLHAITTDRVLLTTLDAALPTSQTSCLRTLARKPGFERLLSGSSPLAFELVRVVAIGALALHCRGHADAPA